MTRKKNKTHAITKEHLNVDIDLEPVAIIINGEEGTAELSPDSGTASPAVDTLEHWRHKSSAHHCSESIKAWKFYQACILERYHWFLDKKRGGISREFAAVISQACLHLKGDNLSVKTLELQTSMSEQLRKVDVEEKLANVKFRENIKRLEAGDDMVNLVSVDPHITLDQVSQFINKYVNCTDEVLPTREKNMSHSFSGSTSSEDSGVVLPESNIAGSLGLSSLSDIWKPDGGVLLDSSFSTSGLYTSRSDGVNPFAEANLFTTTSTESLSVPQQPTIADDDSAILQAVVYKPEPEANLVNDALVSNLGNAFLGLTSFTSLSTEYRCVAAPLYQEATPIPQVSVDSAHLLAFPNNPSQLDVNTSNEEGQEETCVSAKEDVEVKKKKKKKKTKADTKSPSEAVHDVEPVKFTDQKTMGTKEKKLLDQLSFGWEEIGNEVTATKGCIETAVESVDSPSTMVPQKPLSFAAVASTIPKHTLQVKTSTEPSDTTGSVVFSTKKPGRKFSKSSSLNKTSICWTFMNSKKCPWGVDCIFAHGKKELQPFPKWFKKEEHASKAPSKRDHPPHLEPCGNHYCYWRIQYLRRKTATCKLWQSKRCPLTMSNCPYAHGQSDLKPLPKLEMCRSHMNGNCTMQPTECVYAHSKAELRASGKKKSIMAGKKVTLSQDCMATLSCSPTSRLRTISEASTTSNDSWSSIYRQERVRTISGTSLQSNDSQMMRDLEEFDWKAWDSQQEVPTDEELDDEWNQDECVICAFDFSDDYPKFSLECEHDSFHIKCISQWIMNKDKSCPICRHPTDLNDERFQQLQYVDEDEESAIMVDE